MPPQLSFANAFRRVKHDDCRVVARKDSERVKLYKARKRLTDRFSLIVEACSQSCIIDGEAVACGDDGISSFDRIRYRQHDATVPLRLRPDRTQR